MHMEAKVPDPAPAPARRMASRAPPEAPVAATRVMRPGRDGGAGTDDSGAVRSDRQGAARASVVGGGGAAPADVPDGRDDDIVARQIREAAMKETDPELRDKLWDEYRKYKKGK